MKDFLVDEIFCASDVFVYEFGEQACDVNFQTRVAAIW